MTKSKFWPIFILSYTIVMFASIITFSVMQNNISLDLPEPDKVVIYNGSQVATKTFVAGSEEYEQIVSAYNNMSQKTMLQQLVSGHIINNNVTEGTNRALWLDSNKESGIWIEFCFNNPKKMVVSIDGNTRRIDTKGIIFRASSKDTFSDISIYYREGDKFSQTDQFNEKAYPLVIEANTSELYTIVKGIL